MAWFADFPSYKNILLVLCDELRIPNYNLIDGEDVLEERIVNRVFCQSLEKMSREEISHYKNIVELNSEDKYWQEVIKSSLLTGGLALGQASGFGLYVAASSALAAFGKGLGLSFAWGTFTTLSSALSTLFSPLGVGLAASAAAVQWSKSRPKKLLPLVLFLAIARGRIQAESTRPMGRLERIRLLFVRLFRSIFPRVTARLMPSDYK